MSPSVHTRALRVAPLLFSSGACALVYQTAWQRELRLVFGASTAASAAVLAIFIGGLGTGGLLLGRRADAHPRPLAFYAQLELAIAATAALSPFLLSLVGTVYRAIGGTSTLGTFAGTLARLVLAGIVLAPPTLLMGASLPAAAGAAETDDDSARRGVALLYGANTLGAVAGCVLSTFVLLETLGTRRTLWAACALNALVSLVAFALSRTRSYRQRASVVFESLPAKSQSPVQSPVQSLAPASAGDADPPLPQPAFVLAVAATAGFVFFLLEIVWYRMLGPLLGGSVYSFGLILAVALAGIGIGGALASAMLRKPTLQSFALTSVLEAFFVAIPFALGDRLALLALLLRPLGALGFAGSVMGWTFVTAIVVLPAAIVSGVQFALLVALLGRGRHAVGHHLALAYAANTGGAMVGALAGGFLLVPWLGAVGCWRLAAILLALLGVVSVVFANYKQNSGKVGRIQSALVPTVFAVAAIALVQATGPTAVWRHGQIGVGRVSPSQVATPNGRHAFENAERRAVRWEAEGVESSVAESVDDGALRFLVNGKVDGNARTDAATQVMVGLVGALLHPHPVSSLVIGLGTGSTAGWLGAIPEMERVDVAELEPVVRRVAADCAVVNHGVLENPKVHLRFGDARETLLTEKDRYSIIASEPSNPYRAGVATLYSEEFYRAVADRLDSDGIFLQWLQAYDVDSETVRTVYATLHQVFPSIETWQLLSSDLLLVASKKPIVYSASRLRERVAQEPYRSALLGAWRVTDLEGVLAHYVARPSLAETIAESVKAEGGALATDDRSPLEFRFARDIGLPTAFSVTAVREVASVRSEDLPEFAEGSVERERVEDERVGFQVGRTVSGAITAGWTLDQERRAEALALYSEGNTVRAVATWLTQQRAPSTPTEIALVAEGLADAVPEGQSEAAVRAIEALRRVEPIEADAIASRLHFRLGHYSEAVDSFIAAFVAYRRDPWPSLFVMERALRIAPDLATRAPDRARALYDALRDPFAAFTLDERRLSARLSIAAAFPSSEAQTALLESLSPYEPFVPWQAPLLLLRRNTYKAAAHPLAALAEQQLDAFLSAEPARFDKDLLPVRVSRER